MGDWIHMTENRGRIKAEARPPFIRVQIEEGGREREYSLIAEAVMCVKLERTAHNTLHPDARMTVVERTTVTIGVRDSHKSHDFGRTVYIFEEDDDAKRFENDVVSALTHAGNWRRR